jgi:hypothetical protein
LKNEVWKRSRLCPCLSVSNKGRVKTIDRIIKSGKRSSQEIKGKIKKQQEHSNGYKSVCISINNKSKRYLVHRLVANEYIQDVEGKTVNHINFNKQDNYPGNLEVVSIQENLSHYRRSKRYKIEAKIRGSRIEGDKNPCAKIENSQAQQIIDEYKKGKSPKQLQEKYNIKRSSFWNLISGKTYKMLKR